MVKQFGYERSYCVGVASPATFRFLRDAHFFLNIIDYVRLLSLLLLLLMNSLTIIIIIL